MNMALLINVFSYSGRIIFFKRKCEMAKYNEQLPPLLAIFIQVEISLLVNYVQFKQELNTLFTSQFKLKQILNMHKFTICG